MIDIEGIIFYIILLDSIFANLAAWFFSGWYRKKAKRWNKIMPLTKGWALVYLVLTLWIGSLLYRLGVL